MVFEVHALLYSAYKCVYFANKDFIILIKTYHFSIRSDDFK